MKLANRYVKQSLSSCMIRYCNSQRWINHWMNFPVFFFEHLDTRINHSSSPPFGKSQDVLNHHQAIAVGWYHWYKPVALIEWMHPWLCVFFSSSCWTNHLLIPITVECTRGRRNRRRAVWPARRRAPSWPCFPYWTRARLCRWKHHCVEKCSGSCMKFYRHCIFKTKIFCSALNSRYRNQYVAIIFIFNYPKSRTHPEDSLVKKNSCVFMLTWCYPSEEYGTDGTVRYLFRKQCSTKKNMLLLLLKITINLSYNLSYLINKFHTKIRQGFLDFHSLLRRTSYQYKSLSRTKFNFN